MSVFSLCFVCSGNICRSPLAQAVFESRVKSLGIADRFFVDSFGMHNYHQGELPDPRTRKNAQSHGVTANHRAQMATKSALQRFDLILAMANEHVVQLERLVPEQSAKIKLFRSFEIDERLRQYDVPDPYYGDASDFEKVFVMVDRVVGSLIQSLTRSAH